MKGVKNILSSKPVFLFTQQIKRIVRYGEKNSQIPKGQLISKCLFGAIVSTKIATQIL